MTEQLGLFDDKDLRHRLEVAEKILTFCAVGELKVAQDLSKQYLEQYKGENK